MADASNQNGKKRNREQDGIAENGSSANHSNAPPPKKRRIQSKKRGKTRSKDMNKWSIADLKMYLNQNSVSYSMQRDKSYYLRLAQTTRARKQKVQNDQNSNNQQNKELMMNGNLKMEETKINESTSSDSATSATESAASPFVAVPKIPTPPLPSNLNHLPLTQPFEDEEDDDIEDHENDQREADTHQQRSEFEEEFETQLPSLITPQSRRSKTLIERENRMEPMYPAIVPSAPLRAAPPHAPLDSFEGGEEEEEEEETLTSPQPEQQLLGDHEHEHTHCRCVHVQGNADQFDRYEASLPPVPPQTHASDTTHHNQHDQAHQEAVPMDGAPRLGPFQDLREMFSFEGYSTANTSWSSWMPFKVNLGNNKYLILLCSAVAVILMAMCIPYAVSLFVASPFCDNDKATIGGTYAVLNGAIPLQSIMKCQTCPFGATCKNGEAVCGAKFALDAYKMICLPDEDDSAQIAADLAHTANVVLSEKLGLNECGNRDVMYQFDEDALIKEVRSYCQSIRVHHDETVSESVDVGQERNEINDNVEEQQSEDKNAEIENSGDNDKTDENEEQEMDENQNTDHDESANEEDRNIETNKDENHAANADENTENEETRNAENDDIIKVDSDIDERKQSETEENREQNQPAAEETVHPEPANKEEPEDIDQTDFMHGPRKITEQQFMSAWNYAKKEILRNGYAKQVIQDEKTKKYEALHAISPNLYCSGLRLYEKYVSRNSDIPYRVLFGFAAIIVTAVAGVWWITKRADKELNADALDAANLVLQHVSQHRNYHFSIDQLKTYTMNSLNISESAWTRAMDYVNDSQYVQVVPEDVDGHIRACWKWNAVVPFVRLN